MLFSHFLALSTALTPCMVSAALFPKSSQVKTIDAKGFRDVMKENVRLREAIFDLMSYKITDNVHCGLHCALVWGVYTFPCGLFVRSLTIVAIL